MESPLTNATARFSTEMKEIQIYASATIAILGVAYPILLQVISRLDEKYDSDHIVELFEKEKITRRFVISLAASLISIFLWTLNIPPLILNDYFFMENSVAILVIVSTVTLILMFFCFVDKVMTYYTPKKLVCYFRQEHYKSGADFIFLEAMSDIFLVSIRKRWVKISTMLSSFFYDEFEKTRKKCRDKPVEYEQEFYRLVYNAVQELAILKERRNQTLEKQIGGGVWLLGGEGIVSERTYNWLWNNLLLSIQYKHDDMILFYWENADQYFSNTLSGANMSPTNNREDERQKFTEFHYILGALLVFQEKFRCIGRTFEYTGRSNRYVLLPTSMDEIFSFFFKRRKSFDPEYEWVSGKFPFPGLSGVNSDDTIKYYISCYMVVLFLRQYTLRINIISDNPMTPPQLPFKLEEKKECLEGLSFFRGLVKSHLNNIDMLKMLKLDFITEDWCEKHGELHPLKFIDEFKNRLEE